MATDCKVSNGLIGVVVGAVIVWIIHYADEVFRGAKLKIDCKPPGNTGENNTDFYMRFRVQNSAKRRVARNCRAYLVGVYKTSKGKAITDNLIADTVQLRWAGWELEPRDIPAKIEQYVDLVRFNKQVQGWKFDTKPPMFPSFLPAASRQFRSTEEPTASQWWLLVMVRNPRPRRFMSIMTAIGRAPACMSSVVKRRWMNWAPS